MTTAKKWTCIRCPDGPYTWVSILGRKPKKCPNCKSAYFDVPISRPITAAKIRAAWQRKRQEGGA